MNNGRKWTLIDTILEQFRGKVILKDPLKMVKIMPGIEFIKMGGE